MELVGFVVATVMIAVIALTVVILGIILGIDLFVNQVRVVRPPEKEREE